MDSYPRIYILKCTLFYYKLLYFFVLHLKHYVYTYFSFIRFCRYFVWISLLDSNGEFQNIWCTRGHWVWKFRATELVIPLILYHMQVSLVCYYTSSFYSIILTSLAKATSSVIFQLYFGFFITLTITEVTQSMQWLIIYMHFICPCQNKNRLFKDGNSDMSVLALKYLLTDITT